MSHIFWVHGFVSWKCEWTKDCADVFLVIWWTRWPFIFLTAVFENLRRWNYFLVKSYFFRGRYWIDYQSICWKNIFIFDWTCIRFLWAQLHLSKFHIEMLYVVLIVKHGNVRRWQFLLSKEFPREATEERMVHYLLCTTFRANSLFWILDKQFSKQVYRV